MDDWSEAEYDSNPWLRSHESSSDSECSSFDSATIDEQMMEASQSMDTSLNDRFAPYMDQAIAQYGSWELDQILESVWSRTISTPNNPSQLKARAKTPISSHLEEADQLDQDFHICIPTRIKKVGVCSGCFCKLTQHKPSAYLTQIIDQIGIWPGNDSCDDEAVSLPVHSSAMKLSSFTMIQLLLSDYLRLRFLDPPEQAQSLCRGHCAYMKSLPVSVEELKFGEPGQLPKHRLLKELLLQSLKKARPYNPYRFLRSVLSKFDDKVREPFKHLAYRAVPNVLEHLDQARQHFALELKPVVLEVIADLISEHRDGNHSSIDALVDEDCNMDCNSQTGLQTGPDDSTLLRLIKVYLGLNLPVKYFEHLLSLIKIESSSEWIRQIALQHLHRIFTSQTLLKTYPLRIIRLLDELLKQAKWRECLPAVQQALLHRNLTSPKLEDTHPLAILFRLSYIGDILDNMSSSSFGREMAGLCDKFESNSLRLPASVEDPVQFVCMAYETHLESIMVHMLEADPEGTFSFLSQALQNNLQRVTLSGILGLLSPETAKSSSNGFSLTLSRILLHLVGLKLSQVKDGNFTQVIDVEIYSRLQLAVYGNKTDVIDVRCEAKLTHNKKSNPRHRSCTSKPEAADNTDLTSQIAIEDSGSNLDFDEIAIASSLSQIGSKEPGNNQSSICSLIRQLIRSKANDDASGLQSKSMITRLVWYALEVMRLHLVPTLQEMSNLRDTYITVEQVSRSHTFWGHLAEGGKHFLRNLEKNGAVMKSYLSAYSCFDDANQVYAIFLKILLQFCGVKNYPRTRHTGQTRLSTAGLIFLTSTPISFLTELKNFHEIYLKNHPSIRSSLTEDYLKDFITLIELLLSGMLLAQHRPARHIMLELLLLYAEEDTHYMGELLQRTVSNKKAFLCGLFDYYTQLGVGNEDHDLQLMVSMRWKLNMLFDQLWGQRRKILQFGSGTSCNFQQALKTVAKFQSTRNYILHSVSDWSRTIKDLVASVAEFDTLTKSDIEGAGRLQDYEKARLEKTIKFNVAYQTGLVQILHHLSETTMDLVDQADCRQMFCTTLNHVVTKLQSAPMVSVAVNLQHLALKHQTLLNAVARLLQCCLSHKAWLPTLLSSDNSFDSRAVTQLADMPAVRLTALPGLVDSLPGLLSALEREAQLLANPPEEYLCSISCCLMAEPVRLLSSGVVVDKPVLLRHFVCNGQTDPFTRRPMSADSFREEPQLKTRIEAWRNSRLLLEEACEGSPDGDSLPEQALGKRSSLSPPKVATGNPKNRK